MRAAAVDDGVEVDGRRRKGAAPSLMRIVVAEGDYGWTHLLGSLKSAGAAFGDGGDGGGLESAMVVELWWHKKRQLHVHHGANREASKARHIESVVDLVACGSLESFLLCKNGQS